MHEIIYNHVFFRRNFPNSSEFYTIRRKNFLPLRITIFGLKTRDLNLSLFMYLLTNYIPYKFLFFKIETKFLLVIKFDFIILYLV
jgi:hypothetical protein